MNVAALTIQSDIREIASLERFGHDMRWVDENGAAEADVPLVVTGALAVSQPTDLKFILRCRMQAGRGTLIVPRFRPCNLAEVLSAPTDIEVLPLETESLKWRDEDYRVPGSVVFRTKLHVNKWAIIPGAGVQLMAFQPTTARGRVVLCSAAVTGRRVGSHVMDQRRLLDALLAACIAKEEKPVEKSARIDNGPLAPAELLAQYPQQGPGLLIAMLFRTPASQPEQLCERARSLVGVDLELGIVEQLARRMRGGRDEIETALTDAGWSAFVRKARQYGPEVQHG